MSSVFDDIMKKQENFEKKEKTVKKLEYSLEHKKLVEEANEKIRQDRIRQEEAIEKSKDYFAL